MAVEPAQFFSKLKQWYHVPSIELQSAGEKNFEQHEGG